MEQLFIKIVNMSISAGWIVVAVLVLRLIMKKAPRWITVLLWGIVAVRLICPFTIESVFSLIPSAQTISPHIMFESSPSVTTGVPILNDTINPIINFSFAPNPMTSVNPLQILIPIFAVVWIVGIVFMLIYTLFSYIGLRKRICTAVVVDDNIYQSESVISPFVLGIVKPKIYLPFNINPCDMDHVILHEKAHISRKDHLWKPLGFLLLSVYWFNPLIWLGYLFLCRDIEVACDEKVIKKFTSEQKADYSQALLSCSVNRRIIAACPLAFGEVNVKDRVKSVLNYKKPAFWVVVFAIIISIIVAVCFLTSPKGKISQKRGSDLEGVSLEIVSINYDAPAPSVEIKWTNNSDKEIVFGEEFYIYQNLYGNWEDCRVDLDYVVHLLGYPVSAGTTRTHKYSLNMLNMSTAGKYRFETDFTIHGAAPDEYKVWIEFELSKGVAPTAVFTFDPELLVYDHGMFSFVQSADAAPTYLLVNDMQLAELSDDGEILEIGALESIKLNDDNFDSRFSQSDYSWFGNHSLKDLKQNNKRAWQLKVKRENDTLLYILFEQNDSTFYLGYGYSQMDLVQKPNSDNSLIRWLYKLKVIGMPGGTASEKIN